MIFVHRPYRCYCTRLLTHCRQFFYHLLLRSEGNVVIQKQWKLMPKGAVFKVPCTVLIKLITSSSNNIQIKGTMKVAQMEEFVLKHLLDYSNCNSSVAEIIVFTYSRDFCWRYGTSREINSKLSSRFFCEIIFTSILLSNFDQKRSNLWTIPVNVR